MRRTRSRLRYLLWSSLISLPQAAIASEPPMLAQRLAEPVLLGVDSSKQIAELEYCVANAMTASEGVPQGAYRNGDDRVVIFANRLTEYKVFLAVTLIKIGSGTRIEARGRNAKALQGFREALSECS